MNILLIFPKFPDTFWSFSYALRFIGKKSAFPPLGLITVAALLPEQFQIRLVDLNVETLGDDDLAWADMAFISAMAVQRKSAEGCPFNCEFCNITALFGRMQRTKTPQQVVAELDAIYQAGWRGNIFFVDDNFKGSAPGCEKNSPLRIAGDGRLHRRL